MLARHAVAVVTLLSFSPALAENLDAEAARRFIVGKLFAFTCADGSRGAARVYDDGSVIGTIQFHGSEQPARYGCRRKRSSSQARQSALHSIAPSCALHLAKPVIKVFGSLLRD
jgi:hypothetical protein